MKIVTAVVQWLVVQKVRLERGKSYISILQNIALLLLLFQSYGVSQELQIILGIFSVLGLWLLGYLDETRIHGWQHENEYVAKLNPMMVRIDENTKGSPK